MSPSMYFRLFVASSCGGAAIAMIFGLNFYTGAAAAFYGIFCGVIAARVSNAEMDS